MTIFALEQAVSNGCQLGITEAESALEEVAALRADLDRAIVNFGDAAATVCDLRAQLAEAQDALEAAQRLFKEALPKFNWGASFLDANAIQLLNEVPAKVTAAIKAAKVERMIRVTDLNGQTHLLHPNTIARITEAGVSGKWHGIMAYVKTFDGQTQADLEAAEKLLLANGYTITPPAKPLTFEDVMPMTEAPPEGTVYWVVSALHWEGVFCVRFFNAEFDPLLLKRRMAYLEKEHALIAAKHIFGLKGGEL